MKFFMSLKSSPSEELGEAFLPPPEYWLNRRGYPNHTDKTIHVYDLDTILKFG